jgi:hypothetical protein
MKMVEIGLGIVRVGLITFIVTNKIEFFLFVY